MTFSTKKKKHKPVSYTHLDPDVQEEWKKMTLQGDRPTPEEVINYAVKQLKGN